MKIELKIRIVGEEQPYSEYSVQEPYTQKPGKTTTKALKQTYTQHVQRCPIFRQKSHFKPDEGRSSLQKQ